MAKEMAEPLSTFGNQEWQELVTTALLGTSRRAVSLPDEGGALGALFSRLTGADSERKLLAASSVLELYRRAGALPTLDAEPLPEPCEPDSRPLCSGRAAQHLVAILSGGYEQLLGEWLAAADRAGKRVPEELLPVLLETGRTNAGYREAIEPVLGKRGIWLAAQQPAWSYVQQAGQDIEAAWETGNRDARLSLLAKLRSTNPARARELVAEGWKQEPADTRAAFLKSFDAALSMDDEPYLETALDDKSKQVREAAAELLAKLPQSRLVARMIERSRGYLTLREVKKLLISKTLKLDVTLPEELDQSAVRDGISTAAKPGRGQKAGWLLDILSRVPPSTWSEAWGRTAEEIVQAAVETEWRDTLLRAWITASTTFKDVRWAEALLARGPLYTERFDSADLLYALPPERREAIVIQSTRSRKNPIAAKELTPRMLWRLRTPWSAEVSRAVLLAVREYLAATSQQGDWEMRGSVIYLARAISPDLLNDAITILGGNDQSRSFYSDALDKFAATVQFRKDMLEALSQPTP